MNDVKVRMPQFFAAILSIAYAGIIAFDVEAFGLLNTNYRRSASARRAMPLKLAVFVLVQP